MRFKLHLNKRDDIVYHVLLDNERDKYDTLLSSTQKNSRVFQNYLLFYDMISDYVGKGGTTGSILEALRSLTIIELEITHENPQEIFESLNSTGMDLTNVDLLRNYFLMQFAHDQQTMLYENYWSRIEDEVGVDRMEQFFVDFLVFRKRSDAIAINGRRNHINERNLYYAFKDYYVSMPIDGNFEKTASIFADLRECAEIYRNFVFSDDVNLDKETPIRKKLYYLLTINDSTKARSLLLYVFDLYKRGCINEDMLNEAVDGISSLTFRAKICKAQGINRQFAGNMMARLDEIKDYGRFSETFWQAITVGKGSFAFPSDAEFKDALINKDLYQILRSRGAKYLLYMLEKHSPYPKGLPPFDTETLSIEHVMPQTLNAHWKLYLTKDTMQNYESSLHRLGNLALTNYNGEMSNKSFEEKKQIYAEDRFHYTKKIAQEYDKWQISEINDRARKLANEALKIWILPEQYQSMKAVPESLHTLGEDTSQFTYTKPSMLLIGSAEYSVNYWADFLPILCKTLIEENHDSFLEIARPEKISAFGIEDEEHEYASRVDYVHITDHLYVRKTMNTQSILDTMSRISSAFDKVAGTEYKDSIMFSLK